MHKHTDLDLKGLLLVTQIKMSWHISVELCNIRFHENLFSCYIVKFMQTDMVKITGGIWNVWSQTHH
jgi:hypothetical protein